MNSILSIQADQSHGITILLFASLFYCKVTAVLCHLLCGNVWLMVGVHGQALVTAYKPQTNFLV